MVMSLETHGDGDHLIRSLLSLATCNILSQLPFSVTIVDFIFHPLKYSSVYQETEVTLLLVRNTQGDEGIYLTTLSH